MYTTGSAEYINVGQRARSSQYRTEPSVELSLGANPLAISFAFASRVSDLSSPSVPDNPTSRAMSEAHFDEYEHFNYDYDKHIFTGHGGKQRSKREAVTHTNHFDPSGHSRKILTKLRNSEHNKRQTDNKPKA